MSIIQNFKTFDSKHCETTATKSLLLHLGYEISEPMLLGLASGFGFIYWKMSFMNLPFIGGRAKQFELTRQFCENMGFELDARQTGSKKKAWQNVKDAIDAGNPVGLQLDCYHLEHFNHSFHFAGHFIAMYGYDDTHAYVFDTGKTYKVSLENLEKARFEKGSMYGKALSYTIQTDPAMTPAAIASIIPKAVHAIAHEFLNPPIKNFGYPGIQKLAKEMRKWLSIAPTPKADLNDQAMLMEDGGTGGAIFRNFFRDFLFESLDHLPGNAALSKAAELYKKAAANWTEIAGLIKQAGDNEEQSYLLTASDLCLQTGELEREAMEGLLQS